jgi:hypothetical protein
MLHHHPAVAPCPMRPPEQGAQLHKAWAIQSVFAIFILYPACKCLCGPSIIIVTLIVFIIMIITIIILIKNISQKAPLGLFPVPSHWLGRLHCFR